MKERIKVILGVVIVIYVIGFIVTNAQSKIVEKHCYHLGTWQQGMPLEGEVSKEDIIEYPCPL